MPSNNNSGPRARSSLRNQKNFKRMLSRKALALLDQIIDLQSSTQAASESYRQQFKKFAIGSTVEAAMLTAFALATQPFLEADTEITSNPLFGSSLIIALNLLLRAIFIPAGVMLLNEESEELSRFSAVMRRFIAIARYVPALCFGIDSNGTLLLLTHEGMHALAAKTLFLNSQPKITIQKSPFLGIFNSGKTHYRYGEGLTSFGERFGMENSHSIFNAAGATGSVAASMFGLFAAHVMKRKLPEAARAIRLTALYTILMSALYAISPETSDCKNPSNDFCKLEDAGVNPWISFFLILTSPIVLQLLLFGTSKAIHACKRKTARVIEIEEGIELESFGSNQDRASTAQESAESQQESEDDSLISRPRV